MKTTQAWGWLAAAVLAAGLNAAYHDGGLAWAHRIADRAQHVSGAVVALASGRADRFLAEAQTLTARNGDEVTAFSDTVFAETEQNVARAEAAYARAEAREQAQCARVQAERARMEARIAVHRACARIPAVMVHAAAFRSIAIPAVDVPEIRIPQIKVPQVEIPRLKVEIPCPGAHFRVPAMPKISMPALPAINLGLSDGPV